ncbi:MULTISPECIES: CAP domain-containing protein [unclassified Streptomyces]|uniref:CAP domain-containing protein n=1 Tax=unclassified Streptomyces TaxID=2593676 RepID=UPI0011CEA0D8|nr:CAP domain-containing protein [Streptomyces sp. me109]TXS73413.1 CAP domain-containing protein [Streptomyces sp. me109]
MGRHRRSAAGRAATSRATGVTDTHGPLTESYGPENLYGYAAIADLPSTAAARSHRKRKAATPVRTGLLGVSAAVALGTAAVAAGVVPGAKEYALGGGGNNSDQVQAVGSPSSQETQQGGTSGSAESRDGQSTSRDADRASSPSAPPTAAAPAAPAATPSQEAVPTEPDTTARPAEPSTQPSEVARPEAPVATAPVTVPAEAAAEAEVLKLVNEERAKVGCTPVTADNALADLARTFSDDMALRDFFDHTDPSGLSPWDRAAKAGITALGGENIARGQADAAAVMDAWMNSEGHRANILNCDFKTLGVGVHLGAGGPWWTQDFGY